MNRKHELKRAHDIRHDGINLENHGKLAEAEAKYDEALDLYRKYSETDDLNYANAVRYPAAIKQRLGKIDDAISLWEEAVERYEKLGITDGVSEGKKRLEEMNPLWHPKRQVVHTRHVLAVKDLAIEAAYFKDKLGFDLDFTAPGWEFLSFGDFKVMLGECSDALWAHETGDHSYFAHCLVENIDDVYEELKTREAEIIHQIGNKPWGLREFSVKTPDGHRITYGQIIGG